MKLEMSIKCDSVVFAQLISTFAKMSITEVETPKQESFDTNIHRWIDKDIQNRLSNGTLELRDYVDSF